MKNADEVWKNTVDGGKFTCKVVRTTKYGAVMTVDVTETGENLMTQDVVLSFGAVFGPDVADVNEWQSTCLKVIDTWYVEQGLTPPQE